MVVQLINAEKLIEESTAVDVSDNQPLKYVEVIWPTEMPSSIIKLQIGANENQSMTIDLQDMKANALSGEADGQTQSNDGTVTAYYTEINSTNSSFGVTNGTSNNVTEYALDVSTHEKATAAIEIYDDAIEKVSSYRSELGALHNCLEHTVNNLSTSAENLTAAESRIIDVDMAKEMMNETKASILVQVSQAILAQANQMPQGVLQLLR